MADIIPPRRGEELTSSGRATLRFADYLERLSDTVNSSASDLNVNRRFNTLALLFTLENRIGSGDALTSDETGFTVDSEKLSVDMTEA